jgi:tripartite-type tricarboxylate transporter receptor subunit TctC
MKEGGYSIHLVEGDAFKAQVKREYALWDDVIKKAGIVK